MRLRRFLLAAVILACGLLILAAWMHKTVFISMDGQKKAYSTWAWNVAGILSEQGILIGAADQIQPSLPTMLQEGLVIEIRRARPVKLLADGQVFDILTTASTPARWLEQAGIHLNPTDRLLSGGAPLDSQAPSDASAVQVERQKRFFLNRDGEVLSIESSAPTVGRALWNAGFRLRAADVIEPPPETPIQNDLQVFLRPARQVCISILIQKRCLYTAQETVGAALVEAGLALQNLDYTVPADDQPIPASGAIRLVRVSESISQTQVSLPYESKYAPVEDLEIDHQKVLQAGAPGLETKQVTVRYADGVEISRQEETWTSTPPQDQIIGYGTQIVQRTIDTPDGPITYWRALTMWVTSYHPSETGSDITASGMKVRKGLVGVDRNYIPFYTRMYVPGYGEAIAADTGAIHGRWIDLAYPDDEYIPWAKYVTVYFLWPPPENIVYIIP